MVIYEVGQKMMRNEATGHRKLTLKMVFIWRPQWQSPAAAVGWRLRGNLNQSFFALSLSWVLGEFLSGLCSLTVVPVVQLGSICQAGFVPLWHSHILLCCLKGCTRLGIVIVGEGSEELPWLCNRCIC